MNTFSRRSSSSSLTRLAFYPSLAIFCAQETQVHLLNESRGSTLEVVVSRMKLRGSAVRFMVVSATVPNVVDVADWIGNCAGNGPATVKEVRPSSRLRGKEWRDLVSYTQVWRRVPAMQAFKVRIRHSTPQGHERLRFRQGPRLQALRHPAAALSR